MKNTIMIDLDDPRSASIGEVIGNKSSKKILNLLSQKEMSGNELSLELKLPLNTIGYNLEKLVDCGLIEKTKDFFWSVKGKRVVRYKLSDKRIIISPRKMIRGIIPALLGLGAVGLLLKKTFENNVYHGGYLSSQLNDQMLSYSKDMTLESGQGFADSGIYYFLNNAPNSWAWFLIGGLFALAIFIAWNLYKK